MNHLLIGDIAFRMARHIEAQMKNTVNHAMNNGFETPKILVSDINQVK